MVFDKFRAPQLSQLVSQLLSQLASQPASKRRAAGGMVYPPFGDQSIRVPPPCQHLVVPIIPTFLATFETAQIAHQEPPPATIGIPLSSS